jgi:putative ABC transport system permease protein
MDTLLQDVRYALRQLIKYRGFTIVAVLTLTLGIGANTAIFSVIRGVLLRPLPFPEPERLMLARERIGERFGGVTAPDYADWIAQSKALDIGARDSYNANLTGIAEPERISVARVTANYLPVLGVHPIRGRLFAAEEDVFGAPKVVILSHSFWVRRFGGDTGVVGRSLTLDDAPYSVIGVMGSDAEGLENGEDVWVPLAVTPQERAATGARFLDAVARLRPGMTYEAASAELRAIAARIAEIRPGSNREFTAVLTPLSEIVVGDSRRSLMLLFGAVGMVLLIACANVANLLLARSTVRVRESAIRTALGARPARLVRQLLTESVLLALLGAVGGLLLASWGTDLLVQALPAGTPRLDQVRLDVMVLGFTLLIATLTGVVFGLAPALRAARPDLAQGLTDAARGSSGVERRRHGATLIVSEIAVALVLLVSAGLLLRSFAALNRVDPGFDSEHITALRIALPQSRYESPVQVTQFYSGLIDRAAALPGVRGAAVASSVPFGSAGYNISVAIEGKAPPARNEDTPMVFARVVSNGYFRTMGIRVEQGRDFEPGDRSAGVRIGIVNETAARRYFAGESVLGRRLQPDDNGKVVEIVGVVADVRGFGLSRDPEPELFYLLDQTPANHWNWTQRAMSLVVRADRDATGLSPGLREAVWSLDRSLPIYSIWAARALIARSVAPRRLFMLLIAGFASVALILAAIGIYGVMTFTVSQRTREMGIRVALGAVRRDVFRLVVGRAMALTAIGLALGLLGAAAATRLLRQSLFGIHSIDPITYLTIALLMCAVTFVASYLPARRAALVDPMVALRNE